jgi:hypothetical protein
VDHHQRPEHTRDVALKGTNQSHAEAYTQSVEHALNNVLMSLQSYPSVILPSREVYGLRATFSRYCLAVLVTLYTWPILPFYSAACTSYLHHSRRMIAFTPAYNLFHLVYVLSSSAGMTDPATVRRC